MQYLNLSLRRLHATRFHHNQLFPRAKSFISHFTFLCCAATRVRFSPINSFFTCESADFFPATVSVVPSLGQSVPYDAKCHKYQSTSFLRAIYFSHFPHISLSCNAHLITSHIKRCDMLTLCY